MDNGGTNQKLNRAQERRDDEYYTLRADVDAEMDVYAAQGLLAGKTICFPCDGEASAFWQWGLANFARLGLRRVVAVEFKRGGRGIRRDFVGQWQSVAPLQGNGDIRSEEVGRIMEEADIIATNPPFSILREIVPLIANTGKGFLLLAPKTVLQYRDAFPLLRGGKMHVGTHTPHDFRRPDGTTAHFGGLCRWITNLGPCPSRLLPLSAEYKGHEGEYPRHDKTGAIECGALRRVPKDCGETLAVPITYLERPDPRFDIVGLNQTPSIGGRRVYARVFIRRRG